jgi:hypothetical protein
MQSLNQRDCPRCNLINTFENKYCSKCSYPLVPDAYEEKAQEDGRFRAMEQKYEQDMKTKWRINFNKYLQELIW